MSAADQKAGDAEKALGNAAYKARQFEDAIAHYEKAWELNQDITYLNNLSGESNSRCMWEWKCRGRGGSWGTGGGGEGGAGSSCSEKDSATTCRVKGTAWDPAKSTRVLSQGLWLHSDQGQPDQGSSNHPASNAH